MPTQPSGEVSQLARAYLDQSIGLMQTNSINRLTIDWSAFRTSVFAQAAGARTIADTYPAITLALERLNDRRSTYRAATGTVLSGPPDLWHVGPRHADGP